MKKFFLNTLIFCHRSSVIQYSLWFCLTISLLSLVVIAKDSKYSVTAENLSANAYLPAKASSDNLEYDAAGNMTKLPQPKDDTSNYELVYDAWGRVVKVKDDGVTIQKNEFDGLNRRIVRDETGAGGDKTHFYYDGQQVVQERKVISGSEDPDPINEYIYHPHYIDAILCRDYDANTDGTAERYHHLYDSTYNVTASVDSNKNVVERYHYDPYGEVTILDDDFSLDADNTSDIGNEFTFTGRRLDPATGLYNFRARYYHAQLGRFISRDPEGYIDGYNLYRGYFVPNAMDPEGMLSLAPDNPGVDRRGTPNPPIRKLKPKKRTLCGILSFTCSNGKTYQWEVYGNSENAKGIIEFGFGKGSNGCVTLTGPRRIECTGGCKAIKNWKAAPGLPILDHEACHACAYEQCGFWIYLKTAVWDNCDDWAQPSVPQW